EKGEASDLKHPEQEKTYNNYVALGIGNYTNIFGELYSNIEFSQTQNMTIGLEHHSSQGGIDGVALDDKFYNTRFDLGYNAEEKNLFWAVNLGLQHELYNWYGVFHRANPTFAL